MLSFGFTLATNRSPLTTTEPLLLAAREYKLEILYGQEKNFVANDVMDGGDNGGTVREDTAKAVRGTTWALISVGGFVVIAAILFFIYFLSGATDNKPSETPGEMSNRSR